MLIDWFRSTGTSTSPSPGTPSRLTHNPLSKSTSSISTRDEDVFDIQSRVLSARRSTAPSSSNPSPTPSSPSLFHSQRGPLPGAAWIVGNRSNSHSPVLSDERYCCEFSVEWGKCKLRRKNFLSFSRTTHSYTTYSNSFSWKSSLHFS